MSVIRKRNFRITRKGWENVEAVETIEAEMEIILAGKRIRIQINATRRILRQKFCGYHKLPRRWCLCQRNNGYKYRFIKIKRQEIKKPRGGACGPMKRKRKIRKSEMAIRRRDGKIERWNETVNGDRVYRSYFAMFIRVRMRDAYKERVMFEMEGDDAPRLFIRVNRRVLGR